MTVTVKWLGHACVQLEYEGKTILIDPWIENPKFPGDEHKPKKIDVMLITHGHNDHLGNAVDLAKEFKPQIPVIHEMSVYLQGQGVENAIGMNFGGVFDYEGIKVALVPSSHSGGFQESDKMHYLGAAGGYVIAFPDSNIFYHCGDTGVTSEMNIIADLYCPNIGLLAIGGHYTMGPKGAAYASKMLNLKRVLPIHWGTFVPPLTGTPEKLRKHLEGTHIQVDDWQPGDAIEIAPADDISQRTSFYQ